MAPQDEEAPVDLLSRHARTRMQQRGISRAGVIPSSEAERVYKSYAIVESDGAVITVGHRYRRIPRPR
jgi:hypothetical protein